MLDYQLLVLPNREFGGSWHGTKFNLGELVSLHNTLTVMQLAEKSRIMHSPLH